MKSKYYVETWDTERQTFSPQPGVRKGPYTLFGLRNALRKLQARGYSCEYHGGNGDPSVYVYRSVLRKKKRR